MSQNFLTTRSLARRTLCVGVIATTALFGLAACGGDDDSASTTTSTTEATTTTAKGSDTAAETAKFDKSIQQELAEVGCHPGAVDGKLGPNTDAAIIRFQEAAGLTPDGELGPETEEALKKAVAEGKKVCTDAATTTTAKAPTTTIPANGQAPCTATALLKGLPAEGETIASYICIGGYAAGSLTDGTKFLLQSEKGQWYAPSQDPCGSASAGIDPKILEEGCPA